MHGMNIKIIMSCVHANREKSTEDKYKIQDEILRFDVSSTFICRIVIPLRSFLDECLVSNIILYFVDSASLYNVVNKANLVHNLFLVYL